MAAANESIRAEAAEGQRRVGELQALLDAGGGGGASVGGEGRVAELEAANANIRAEVADAQAKVAELQQLLDAELQQRSGAPPTESLANGSNALAEQAAANESIRAEVVDGHRRVAELQELLGAAAKLEV